MTREEAEIKAKQTAVKYIHERTDHPYSKDILEAVYHSYLQAYDDLKAKLREVPWTEEEVDNVRPKHWDHEGGFEAGVKWAEKRIKERV